MPGSLQSFFAPLLVVQTVLIVFHDLVEIPGWHSGRQVRAAVGATKFWVGTLINAVFPGLAVFLVVKFWGLPPPSFATSYWAVYCAITVVSAVAMWWWPYFFGTDETTKRLYAAMYAGTRQLLPARGDNPRPNALHIGFHVLFLTNLGLALWLRFG